MPATLEQVKLLKVMEYEAENGEKKTGEVGEVFTLDEDTAEMWVKNGTARRFDEAAEKKAEDLVDAARKERDEMIAIAVTAGMKAQQKESNKTVIQSFSPNVDPRGGYKDFSHFAIDVFRGSKGGAANPLKLEKYLSEQKQTMQEGDDAQGGFLVPVEFRAELLQTALEISIVAPKATFIPMGTNRIEVPAMWDDDHSGGTFFGGVTIYRTAETAQKTKSKPAFGIVQLNLHKITGLAQVTDSLLEDSQISLGPILNKVFGQAMAWTMDNDFINGTGAGMPVGFLNCNALITVAKETGQTADTVVAANVLNMYSRMPSASINNAIWIANHSVLPQLALMTIGNYPVFLPAGGLTGAPLATLLGRPVFFSEKMATLGDTKDIAFIDPTQYLVGGKNGLEIKTATSIHLWFDYDMTAFRFVVRYDGVCWWKTYMTPANGPTMSPFITLAARA